MSWAIGYDEKWKRDIGYGVPAYCDHPGCNNEIDRGLSYVCCDQKPYGGELGCGLYFCSEHGSYLVGGPDDEESGWGCERCSSGLDPFTPKPDHPKWIDWKLTDGSWQKWREENPDEVSHLRAAHKSGESHDG